MTSTAQLVRVTLVSAKLQMPMSLLQIQICSQLFPEYPIRRHAEAHYQLRKAVGVQSSKVHSFDISLQEHRDSRFLIGIDTEKMSGPFPAGIKVRSGDIMTLKLKHKDSALMRLADRIHIVLHTDNMLQISDIGCSMFD